MDQVRVAGDDVGGHRDPLQARDLGLPQVVDQRVALRLGDKVLPVVLADVGRRPHRGKAEIGHSPAHDEVAIEIAHAFPRGYRGQVWRPLSRGEPLRDREVGISGHGYLAGAPVRSGKPFDQIVTISAVLLPGKTRFPSLLYTPRASGLHTA